jgi:hypothetical protein
MDDNKPKSRFSEQDSPFYKPLWRRIVITALVALWVGFEIYQGGSFWLVIAVAMLCYALWIFFLSWPKTPDNPPQ